MPASKVQDEAEIQRWFDEGVTYREMVERYRDQYDIETGPSMFSNLRARRGWQRRIARNDDLIPWAVDVRHRWSYPVALLRMEARVRAGHDISPEERARLDSWKASMRERDLVLHYDPETERGWWCVPRRRGIDLDLIREPESKTTKRRAID